MQLKEGTLFAAVDIGSNSFRLELARYEAGQLVFAGYHKEMVRLGGGLNADGALTAEAMAQGYACLQRFAEHLREMPLPCVQAVATQTLREATNRAEFLRLGSAHLGFPLRTISGREEARLIYNGVSRLLPQVDERRLVIDIGGRSTEIIAGLGFVAERSESVVIGSVSLSLAYFAEGKITHKLCNRAISNAKAILEDGLIVTQDFQWDQAYGASGTIGAVADILIANDMGDGTITLPKLQALMEILLEAGAVDKVKLQGLREDRRAVIAGGLCVLLAVFEVFQLTTLTPAKGALRHGLLYDTLAIQVKAQSRDSSWLSANINVREQTVTRLQHKFRVDMAQAERVRSLALSWASAINMPSASLTYAAALHELGVLVSHVDYHKHGAYLIDRCDVLGFSSGELKRIVGLVLGQRGGLRKMQAFWGDDEFMLKLLLLRLAVIFCHGRKNPPPAPLHIKRHETTRHITLTVQGDWPQHLPQTLYLLHEEIAQWKKVPFNVAWVMHEPQ